MRVLKQQICSFSLPRAMSCTGRFGKDAVDYAKGLAMGHSSCEQQALKEMLDLLSMCCAAVLWQTPHSQTTLKQSCSHNMPCHFSARPPHP